jgi:hypothetical protein
MQAIFGSYGNKGHELIDAIGHCNKLTSLSIQLASDGDMDSKIVPSSCKFVLLSMYLIT